MIVRLLDNIYINVDGSTYLIRASTRGMEHPKNRAVVFYDVTHTYSVAFDRETCMQDHILFSCKQEISDQSVRLQDVFSVLKKNRVSLSSEIINELKSL